jgi:hypothetical protein
VERLLSLADDTAGAALAESAACDSVLDGVLGGGDGDGDANDSPDSDSEGMCEASAGVAARGRAGAFLRDDERPGACVTVSERVFF